MKGLKEMFISNYGEDLNIVKQVKEKLEVIKETGYFTGCNEVNIYYEKYTVENEKGSVVICHGFAECLNKFTEMIYYYTELGYSVYGIEHRGHGRSSNLNIKEKSQVYVEKFEYYIEDLKIFMDTVVKKKGKSMFLYAHSMGGAIGTLFLEKYDGYFEKAILTAPMMEINLGKYRENIAFLLSEFFILIGRGKKYVFGQGPYDGRYNLEASGTSNHYRYKNHLDELNKNETLQRSGAAFKWINEAIKATKKLRKKKKIRNIKIPLLLFQAGKDTFVKEGGHKFFIENAYNCKMIRFDKGKHELYLENDEILLPYLKEIVKFYS